MGGRYCCVQNCRRRSHDHRGRKLPNDLTFHCFPAWRMNEGAEISELTRRRRAAWVAAVGHRDITFDHIPSSMRVCSRHFLSGKPAYEMLESDPDWVPSLHLGRSDRAAELKNFPAEQQQPQLTDTGLSHMKGHKDVLTGQAAGRQAGPGPPPWREAKALLSALQRKSSVCDQERCPAEMRTHISFMAFFRDALEASLDASSRSSAPSQRQRQTFGGSSSSCPNCVRLQKRIEELEEQLLYLSRREQEMQTSSDSNMASITQEQELQFPGPTVKEEQEEDEENEWMKPLSPQDNLHGNSDNTDPVKMVSSSKVAQSRVRPSEGKRQRKRQRFVVAWLGKFPFLRYSPTRDLMWCHVCRLYADKQFQRLPLIQGSRLFKMHNIKTHSESRYHKDSLEIYTQLHN